MILSSKFEALRKGKSRISEAACLVGLLLGKMTILVLSKVGLD